MKVAVGMSGGLDSSVAVILLKQAGYDVLGITLVLYDDAIKCVSCDAAQRARDVARFLDVPHRIIDARMLFRDLIIRPFAEAYAQGRTPSPCVCCNERIKFGFFMDRAMELGCDKVATGHYVNTYCLNDTWHLARGKDHHKDQSYFLHRLTRGQLASSLFPLGPFTRDEVADVARQHRLPVPYDSADSSQDLCFVHNGDYIPVVESLCPNLVRNGVIRDMEGNVLGEHNGIHRYTVGQRKGLGIALGEPRYVMRVDAEKHEIIVGARDEGMNRACMAEHVHWINPRHAPDETLRCGVRIRYRHQAVPARVRILNINQAEILFDEPQFAVTPGQAAVFYDEEEVLGGGWITSTQ
ncbi:MAG: tRNA 2-thiouridine(34) synthase MnmA [Spartobacteria bacterium]|nr:tRNA 2-thiouridine(34) synthase MnmA [Spartobacteria bacterium]